MKVSDHLRKADKRQAAPNSWLARQLLKMGNDLEKAAQKYTGETKHTKAKVEPAAHGVQFRVWLQMDEGDTRTEAQELTNVLLGPEAVVGQHKLVPNLWVATTIVKL
jgi:hypothetical protein